MKPPPVCHVPDCGKTPLLYPAGWLCEDHKPNEIEFRKIGARAK
jgi:hypothetical protein